MLSHLRFHRRGASNPASPTNEHQQRPWSPMSGCESSPNVDAASPYGSLPLSAPITSALPPTLPPITRVTSADTDFDDQGLRDTFGMSSPEARPRISSHDGTGFLGGVALKNYRRDMEAHLAVASPKSPVRDPLSGSSEDIVRRQRLNTPSASNETQQRIMVRQTTSFTTPKELHTSVAAATGRRPAGVRLPSDTPLSVPSTSSAEPPRSRKSLPFLKNPMSTLLMRRKNNSNVPDLRPLPLTRSHEEPIYDPCIRGTRIHDFSVPRRKAHTPDRKVAAPRSSAPFDVARTHDEDLPEDLPLDTVEGLVEPDLHATISAMPSDSAQLQHLEVRSQLSQISAGVSHAGAEENPATQALPIEESSTYHMQSEDTSFLSTSPSAPLGSMQEVDVHKARRAHPSTRTTRSGNPSSEISALPKHMKSTSSRFSFDMVGAAKQERLLEERHRKREMERKSTDAEVVTDSRFDDFDDDAFDYDAMIHDDGLEEMIPGVNADFTELEGTCEDTYEDTFKCTADDELDPDDDQENFAGFIFQKSNPNSTLASPHRAIATPRDDNGKVIGFAMTKDTPSPSDVPASPESLPMSVNYALSSEVSGLGIQPPVDTLEPMHPDDLYFDDGLIDASGEFALDLAMEPEYDAAPFDESIFDINDTDQYGRPVPGAFAHAQELRRTAAQDPAVKRESDVMSRLSAHSAMSRSTAHTSPCAEAQKDAELAGEPPAHASGSDGKASAPAGIKVESIAAYQAALAAAAHQAAVSGKFQWDATPQREDNEQQDIFNERAQSMQPDDCEDFGPICDGLEDFDMDDDAIIAEANASALANDSDEWYGQEFGFYPNPLGQHHFAHSAGSSSKGYDYEYANGGFFGPKGMSGLDRSTSGRMISREPNLTPITERSEYSNRNSLMSMGFPPHSSSTPMLHSPGLAQLAMMADRGDEQMTLSALLRLRSKAWGSSQASLASSREGSPLSERGDLGGSPWNLHVPGAPVRPGSGYGRKNSFLSTTSRDSEGVSALGSPTLTMAMPPLSSPSPAPLSPAEPHAFFLNAKLPSCMIASPTEQCAVSNGFPVRGHNDSCISVASRSNSADMVRSLEDTGTHESSRRLGRGHQRHNSSADSVSYLKEEDCGETRWIMERRRTGESGEVEILEREIVEGCRI